MCDAITAQLVSDHLPRFTDMGPDQALEEIEIKSKLLERVNTLQESNPMLGTRGVRLGMLIPGLYKMQVRAIFEAACRCAADGVDVRPEVMIPLVSNVGELETMVTPLREAAKAIMAEHGQDIPHLFGTKNTEILCDLHSLLPELIVNRDLDSVVSRLQTLQGQRFE